jgi:hypothetical protein
MFCTNCGNEIEQYARFCSRCGTEAAPVPAPQAPPKRDWDMHVAILSWLLIGSALLTGILGMLITLAGQIVSNIPEIWAEAPFGIGQLVGSMSLFLGLSTLAVAAGVAAAGVGLLQYRDWGRVLAIIMCAVMLMKFPLGTAIGVYGLWVLLSERGREHFRDRAASQAQA